MSSDRRDETSGYFPDSWTLGPDGRVWIPPFRNDYRIDVYQADGTLQRTITRRYEPYKRTDLEIEQRRTAMTPWGGRNRRTWNVVVEPTMPDILQMHVDAEGRFDQEVALACEGRAIEDGVLFPGQGLVVVVKELFDATLAFRGRAADDAEAGKEAVPLEVICYRMTP